MTELILVGTVIISFLIGPVFIIKTIKCMYEKRKKKVKKKEKNKNES